MKKRKQLLLDDISDTWYNASRYFSDNTKLYEIITIKKNDHGLEDVYVPESTVISCVRRGNTKMCTLVLYYPWLKLNPHYAIC